MLTWIKRNKEWLFSGIAVSVPLAIIGWVGFSEGETIQQNNTGAMNVAGQNLTITTDTLSMRKPWHSTAARLRQIPRHFSLM